MNLQNQPGRSPSGTLAGARSDLTGYAALLGESFDSRVNLLERIIRGSHHPSLGRYKERLLANFIRDYIPRSFDVGTGFVLFPHEDNSPPGGVQHHDPLNQGAFTVSRQCDILVFDAATVPPVFRDDDFVVVRPEAVRAVIEVKGSLTLKDVKSLLESFVDFGRKWRTTQLFYKEHNQATTKTPAMIGMAWRIQARRGRGAVVTPTRVREEVASHYRRHVAKEELPGFPVLDHLFVYNECDISRTSWLDEVDGVNRFRDGWVSGDGRFVRFRSDGTPCRDKDRTVATLLASIHYAVGRDAFNRFFSYADETRATDLVPYAHEGFSTWLEDLGKITWTYSDTV